MSKIVFSSSSSSSSSTLSSVAILAQAILADGSERFERNMAVTNIPCTAQEMIAEFCGKKTMPFVLALGPGVRERAEWFRRHLQRLGLLSEICAIVNAQVQKHWASLYLGLRRLALCRRVVEGQMLRYAPMQV